jgi:CIC family chloride channel protein
VSLKQRLSAIKNLFWLRLSKLNQKHLILFLSLLVGIASGIAAAILKNSVHAIQSLLHVSWLDQYHKIFYFAFPLFGLLLTVTIIRYFIKKPIGHGIPSTLYAISKLKGIIPKGKMFHSVITAAITVGFGGSTGLEGPTVATGAAIGSNFGQAFRLPFKSKALLIGCASAGAMAAIFQAPVAAIVFAIEVIMLDLTMGSLIPLLLASIAAVITSKLMLGEDVLFRFDLIEKFKMADIPFYVVLGISTGFLSIYFSKAYFFVIKQIDKIKGTYSKAWIGGISLGALIFILPPLYGEGFETINALISDDPSGVMGRSLFDKFGNNEWALILFVLGLSLFKVIATTITFESGGVGGVFAPSLFMGSTFGFVFARVGNMLGIGNLSVSNFTLVSMAGLMAGVLHAPLTAMFLIAEITGGYELFIPLMITVAISYTTNKLFLPHTIYTTHLAQRGELLTHHADKNVLTLMNLTEEIEDNFSEVSPEYTLRQLVKVVAKSSRNLFPVINEKGELAGIVLLDDIREIMFQQDQYDTVSVSDIMTQPPLIIDVSESMEKVMQYFEECGAWNLPVVKEGKYLGFVSKSKLFSVYREWLVQFSED